MLFGVLVFSFIICWLLDTLLPVCLHEPCWLLSSLDLIVSTHLCCTITHSPSVYGLISFRLSISLYVCVHLLRLYMILFICGCTNRLAVAAYHSQSRAVRIRGCKEDWLNIMSNSFSIDLNQAYQQVRRHLAERRMIAYFSVLLCRLWASCQKPGYQKIKQPEEISVHTVHRLEHLRPRSQ